MFQFQNNLLILTLTQVHSTLYLDTIYNQFSLLRLDRSFLDNHCTHRSIHIYLQDILYTVPAKHYFRIRLWSQRGTYRILCRILINYNVRLDSQNKNLVYLYFENNHWDIFYTVPTLSHHCKYQRHNFYRNFDLLRLDRFFLYMHCISHHLLTTNLSDMFHKVGHIDQERIHNHLLCKKHMKMHQDLLLSHLADILYKTFGDYCL